MKLTGKTRSAALGAALLAMAATVAAQKPTRLKVAAAPDQSQAREIARQIEAIGHGPAHVENQGGRFHVYTRTYGTAAEANLAKPYLLGAGFMETEPVPVAGSRAVTEETVFGPVPSVVKSLAAGQVKVDFDRKAAPAGAASRPPISPELRNLDNGKASEADLRAKIFSFSDAADAPQALAAIDSFAARFPRSGSLAAAKLARAHWFIKKGDEQGALEQFEKVIREHPDRPEAGNAEMRCAYIDIRRRKPDADVLRRFEKVARNELASAPDVQLEAMMRCAALYHKGKDHASAQAAYLAISNSSKDPEVQAYAQMQLAAITMEKAWNGEATFEQARRLCDDVVANFPQSNIHTRATAALMALETLAYEKKPVEVLARKDDYLKQYGQTEEAQLAYYWFARAALDSGDTPLARRLAQALVDAKFPTQERFKLVDVTVSARRILESIDKAERTAGR